MAEQAIFDGTPDSGSATRLRTGNDFWSALRLTCAGLGLGVLAACSGGAADADVFAPPGPGGDTDNSDSGGADEDDEPGDPVAPGDVVASLEVVLPDQEIFLLRGTMPLPRGTHHANARSVPFVVVNPDGTAARTQVEVVSSYPSAADGADVVELIARVQRPQRGTAGDRVRYEVAFMPHPQRDIQIDREVREFFGGEDRLVLRTMDVFGHTYEADLFEDVREPGEEVEVMRRGELCKEFRTHEVLLPRTPVNGPEGTMPHMMGVHTNIRFWAREKFFSVDLHVHNGMDGGDPTTSVDDALDKVYFKSLELGLPRGWTLLAAFDHPFFGEPRDEGERVAWPFVRPMADDKLHVMRRQARFVRRFVVARTGHEQRAASLVREEGMAFCQPGQTPTGAENWSWWNSATARYFPQSHRLPRLEHVGLDSIRQELAGDLAQCSNQVASGNGGGYPFTEQGLGWAHPWGIQYGGMTGGDEIWLFDGVTTAAAASQEGYRLSQLVARCYVDRQPTALYRESGRPSRVEDWLNEEGLQGPWLPMYFNLVPKLPNNDPFGFNDAPTFQSNAVANQGRQPGYEEQLLGYMPIDHQHYIRYTRNLKVLTWLGNDSLAKKELELAAELFRLSFHEYNNSNYGHIQSSGLKGKIVETTEEPGQGLGYGRGEAWGIDASLSAYATGSRELRARLYPWYTKIAKVLEDGQSHCTGGLQAWPSSNYLSGQYRLRQSYEAAIGENAIVGMRETVFAGQSEAQTQRLNDVLLRSVYGSISAPFWNVTENAPWNYIAVGPYDGDEPLYCVNVPEGAHSSNVDRSQYWTSFAYAYEINGDEEFLFRAALMAGAGSLHNNMVGGGLGNLGNKAGLLALIQRLEEQD